MPTALESHITATKRHRPRSIARLQWIPTELKYLMPRACPKRSEQGHMAGCQTETSLDWKHEEEWNLAVGPARRAGTDDNMEAEKPRDPPGRACSRQTARAEPRSTGARRCPALGGWYRQAAEQGGDQASPESGKHTGLTGP